MPRIVVVSRNPTLTWGIGSTGHDIVEVRPHQVDDWLVDEGREPADLVVIDVSDSAQSLAVLTGLRRSARLTPALLVAGDDPGWHEPEITQLPGAEVLPLPVSAQGLQAAMSRLLTQGAGDELWVEPNPDTDTPAVPRPNVGDAAPAADAAATVEPADLQVVDETDERSGTDLPPLRRSPRTSRAVREALAGTSFADQVAQVANVTRSSMKQRSGGSSGRDVVHPVEVPPAGPVVFPQDKPARTMDSANALARTLTLRIDELYGVPETAEVIVADAVERIQAEHAALMLPDGSRWRVAAGIGLGGIERRFELTEDSWVIAHVARASKGVIVDDTDVARRPFQRAPLASRKHLLAAPIRLVEGVLLVARDSDPGFTEDALAELAHLGEEAGLLLAAALDVRDLARRLQAFTDLGE